MSRKQTGVGAGWNAAAIQHGVDALLQRMPEAARGAATRERLHWLVQHMAADGVRRDDPIREVFARLGDKWSPLLLLLLAAGSFRHAALRRLAGLTSVDGRISQRMLTLRLRSLERDGLIRRSLIAGNPPGVLYSITPVGRGLVEQIEALMAWTRGHAAEIRRARADFAITSRNFPSEES